MLQKDFNPILRFVAVSDVHYKDDHCIEEERMEKALEIAYRLSEAHPTYKKLDAVVANGDFANSGTETQMRKFKATMDKCLKPETVYALHMASHEYHGAGVEAAYELFQKIFERPVDNHIEINGFHFITMTSSSGCEYD
jgi:predicted MPP superfamily phosphohydrolase